MNNKPRWTLLFYVTVPSIIPLYETEYKYELVYIGEKPTERGIRRAMINAAKRHDYDWKSNPDFLSDYHLSEIKTENR